MSIRVVLLIGKGSLRIKAKILLLIKSYFYKHYLRATHLLIDLLLKIVK